MLSNFRKIKGMLTGNIDDPEQLLAALEASSIPISKADCRMCSNPCEDGHESYPNKFDVDMESQMFGSVKPYNRQVVISTGKIDWDKDVTTSQGTLAAFLTEVEQNRKKLDKEGTTPPPSGVFSSSDSSRLAVLNGSHQTVCESSAMETVLVFPDYKIVTQVPRSLGGASDLWTYVLDHSLGRAGLEKSPFKTWVLPYSCVILLCSHKRRDNRCAIAGPKLAATFTQSLERRGWDIHTQLGGLSSSILPPLEESTQSTDEKEKDILDRLKLLRSESSALILHNSHTGGHRYAGNCIIYTPEGSGVWYGRVTPHEVESIVENTIIGGRVLPPLLRGGVNISRPECSTLHDW